jgi:2-isopropylmalate synthase
MERVIIFDTSLRDGEQAAGGTLNVNEKLEIARQLEKMKVDIIEAGFPASTPGDFEAVKLIAEEVRGPVICALSHASFDAIDRAWEAIKMAAHPRVHIFLSSSDIHLLHQLKKSRDEIFQSAVNSVLRAFTDGCQPHGSSIPLSNIGGCDRCGCDHREYSRYRGLCDSPGMGEAYRRNL